MMKMYTNKANHKKKEIDLKINCIKELLIIDTIYQFDSD